MTITDKLQRVLNSAARLITATGKFDRGLSQLLHDDLHWLDVPQRVQYKLAVMVHRCLGRRAPSYLADYCVPVSTVPGRQHLRSASRRQLIVPRVRRSTFGARAFAIAGPTVWNSLPDSLRDPAVGPDQFRRDLKRIYLSDTASRLAHYRCFRVMRYTNRHFTYLLTYPLHLTPPCTQ